MPLQSYEGKAHSLPEAPMLLTLELSPTSWLNLNYVRGQPAATDDSDRLELQLVENHRTTGRIVIGGDKQLRTMVTFMLANLFRDIDLHQHL